MIALEKEIALCFVDIINSILDTLFFSLILKFLLCGCKSGLFLRNLRGYVAKMEPKMMNFLDPVISYHNVGYYLGVTGFRIKRHYTGKITLERNPVQLVSIGVLEPK